MSPICLWLRCYSEPLDPAALFRWHAGRAGSEQGNPVLNSWDLSLEQMEIGFIIPAGPEDRGSSKLWSLSRTSVFLPVGAGVFVLTGQSTWAYGDSAWRKGSLLRQAWKCIWAWEEACFAQISYLALVPPFPQILLGFASYFEMVQQLSWKPWSGTAFCAGGLGQIQSQSRWEQVMLGNLVLYWAGDFSSIQAAGWMSFSETSKQGELMLSWDMRVCTLHWGLKVQ